ncbi:MAG: UDP-N-acetylglucosamine 2-epimerase (non-hydrolyzing) [Bacteroides sp.]|jgi:UDP-GlcNAc3NAcA epimerase|nr:UDP-N-acetylglucosamine 2-epimerase (non-hydrolyzing) [Bacteroides sp.]
MKKILTIIGARPQFIKAAAVSREIARRKGLKEVIVHTGQHFDHNMSQVFFEQMHIPEPAYNLAIHNLPHGAMTGRMLERAEEVMLKENPDWVMVYGDTNSTLAGALAAKKIGLPVAHVEAGLRSFNMAMPEEINRILTDRIADLLFCPSQVALDNLEREGFDHFDNRVLLTGDVMYDAYLHFSDMRKAPKKLKLPAKFGLVTLHRAENTDQPETLKEIVEALNEIAAEFPLVLPIHPRTFNVLNHTDVPNLIESITVIEPVSYLEILYLLEKSHMVLTDSGGLQKEAYFAERPCITLRKETEWTELVDAGYNLVSGTSKKAIVEAFDMLNKKRPEFTSGLYGIGNAAAIIADAFLQPEL